MVGVKVVNTFIGRDPAKTVEANFELFHEVWPPLLAEARAAGVQGRHRALPHALLGRRVARRQEHGHEPGLLAAGCSAAFPDGTLGLNFDPSHLVWQSIDVPRAVREFGPHIVHVHAKDERIDRDRLYEVGVMGLDWHQPKLPGLGDVAWGPFFAALTDAGYDGPVCIEVEDRAYEGSLADRRRALRQSKRFLEQFVG